MKLTAWQDYWMVVIIGFTGFLVGVNIHHFLGLAVAFIGIILWDRATEYFDLVEETEILR